MSYKVSDYVLIMDKYILILIFFSEQEMQDNVRSLLDKKVIFRIKDARSQGCEKKHLLL